MRSSPSGMIYVAKCVLGKCSSFLLQWPYMIIVFLKKSGVSRYRVSYSYFPGRLSYLTFIVELFPICRIFTILSFFNSDTGVMLSIALEIEPALSAFDFFDLIGVCTGMLLSILAKNLGWSFSTVIMKAHKCSQIRLCVRFFLQVHSSH